MERISISGVSAAANLTGFLSNATGATWTLAANDAADSLAHKVTIRNDSATDHSAKTAVLTGTGHNGAAQTETVNLPAGTATVTSTKYFLTLTTVVPSATIGGDTMDIGWAVDSVSPPLPLRKFLGQGMTEFNVGFGCVIAGTPTYTVQHTFEGETWFNHSTVAAKTANADGAYTSPVLALRLLWAAAGTVTLTGLLSAP